MAKPAPKAPPESVAFYEALLATIPAIERKGATMPYTSVNGNMFSGLFGSAVGVKVSDADRAELEQVDGTGPYGPAERPMSGWTTLPDAWRRHPDQVTEWMGRADAHVSTLPPKKPKAPKKGR